ncbi:MAG: response regulator [Actinomycetota bacterium]
MSKPQKPRLLCVDDEPELLQSIKLNLRRHFAVSTAESAPEALRLFDEAEDGVPFDVVISDMRMPGMSGAEFLTRLRIAHPDVPRLLLSGQSDLDAAIAAINDAKIFRFLTKPCPPEVIIESVNEALEQVRLRNVERELLDDTLSGTVEMLTDVLGVVNAGAYSRTMRLHRLVTGIAKGLGRPVEWDLNLATMLSQIGFVVLPPNPELKATGGADKRHAAMAADLVGNIPRMDHVDTMIRRQLEAAPESHGDAMEEWPEHAIKAEILRVAVRYEAYLAGGLSPGQARKRLADSTTPPPEFILRAVTQAETGEEPMVAVDVTLAQLTARMRLDADLYLSTGSKLASAGTEVTSVLIGRINAFAESAGVREPIQVLAPASIANRLATAA